MVMDAYRQAINNSTFEMNKILVKPCLIGHVIITKNMSAKQVVLVYRKKHQYVYITVNRALFAMYK